MGKSQFQSAEHMEMRFPPFLALASDAEVTDETDVTLKITQPDGNPCADATLTRLGNVDPNTGMWHFQLHVSNYMQGIWMVCAISNGGTAARKQYRTYVWGDYVDDLATLKSRLGTPAGASMAADVAAVKADSWWLFRLSVAHMRIVGTQLIIYDLDGSTPLIVFNLRDADGAPTATRIFERLSLGPPT